MKRQRTDDRRRMMIATPRNLPDGWMWKLIGEFADVRAGSGFPDRYQGRDSGAYPFYKVSDMNIGGNELIMDTANNWINEDVVRELRAKPFPIGTVIFPKVGAAVYTNKKRLLSKSALVDNNVMGVFIRDSDFCVPEFLLFWFQSIDLRDWANPGPLPSINSGVIKETSIPLPPLPEQRAIAHALRTAQQARAARQRELTLERERKAALMGHLFTHGTRNEPRKQTEIGDMPESWRVVKFADVVDVARGQVIPIDEPYKSMMHIGSENIEPNTGRLLPTKTNGELKVISGNYVFEPGDILYSKIRPYLNKVVMPLFAGTCSADIYPLRANKDYLVQTFLFQYLLSETFKTRAISFQDRTGIPKINRDQLWSIALPAPSLDEQRDIATALCACDAKIAALERETQVLDELFRAMLDELMTGRMSAVPLVQGPRFDVLS